MFVYQSITGGATKTASWALLIAAQRCRSWQQSPNQKYLGLRMFTCVLCESMCWWVWWHRTQCELMNQLRASDGSRHRHWPIPVVWMWELRVDMLISQLNELWWWAIYWQPLSSSLSNYLEWVCKNCGWLCWPHSLIKLESQPWACDGSCDGHWPIHLSGHVVRPVFSPNAR